MIVEEERERVLKMKSNIIHKDVLPKVLFENVSCEEEKMLESRKVKALVTGVFLLSVTLMSAPQNTPPATFFVDPETGRPNVIIVVGSKAAVADVVSATMLAAAIGTKMPVMQSDSNFLKHKATHEDISVLTASFSEYPQSTLPDYIQPLGFPTVDVPDAGEYLEWEHNVTPINYTLESLWYFDDNSHTFWGSNDEHFDPWETHEEIQIRFDSYQKDTLSTTSENTAFLYGGDTILHRAWDELNRTKWYAIPGLIYRADNIYAPPMISVKTVYTSPVKDEWPLLEEPIYVPEPQMVLLDMLPQFSLFRINYTVVDAGPVLDINSSTGELGPLHGTPYIVTGKPHIEKKIYLKKGEPLEFSSYTIEILEVDVDHNKTCFQVSQNGAILDTFWLPQNRGSCSGPGGTLEQLKECISGYRALSHLVFEGDTPFSTYDTWNDLDGDTVLDPTEFTNIITYDYNKDSIPDYHKWVVDQVKKEVWAHYTWENYTDDQNNLWLLFNSVDFALDGFRVFIGAKGTIGVEIIVYWVENKKIWYNHLCCDPWAEPGYQLIVDAYQAGWDLTSDNTYLYQPPGTGLWPPAGLNQWVDSVGNSTPIGNGFLDCNDGHIGYEYNLLRDLIPDGYFPEQYDLDKDSGTTNDCTSNWLQNSCKNFDVEDPAGWHGPGLIVLELNLLLCDILCGQDTVYTWDVSGPSREDLPYFALEVTDVWFSSDCSIDYNTYLFNVDEPSFVVADVNFDFTGWKASCSNNLVLIGGPLANIIVKQLVDEGISVIDWETSPGEWEYIVAPYGNCNVLIIAGKDRNATRAAVQKLINELQGL